MLQKIATATEPQPEDMIMEVGPGTAAHYSSQPACSRQGFCKLNVLAHSSDPCTGTGQLTEYLLDSGAIVLAVEKDRNMCEILRQKADWVSTHLHDLASWLTLPHL